MEFGERLRVLRKDKGLTQTEVAKRVGISRRSYITYEQQNKRPRHRETYEKLAKVLGCDINDLLFEENEAQGNENHFSEAFGILARESPVQLAWIAALSAVPFIGSPLAIAASTALVMHSLQDGTNADDMTPREQATPVSHIREVYERQQKEHTQFVKAAMGAIYARLASQGTAFRPVVPDAESGVYEAEEIIAFDAYGISSWWLRFVERSESLKTKELVDAYVKVVVADFLCCPPDRTRKASIVVGDPTLYDALARLKNSNSYRGYLSVVLIDSDTFEITGETYIATHDLDENERNLPMICGEVKRN